MSFDRSKSPLPSGEINFSLPEVQEFILNNGLKVFFVEKNTLPIIQLYILTNAGSKFDPAGKKGTSNLLSMLIDEGAGDLNSLELSDAFDLIGANFNVSTSNDSIHFSVQTLTEHFQKSLDLLNNILTSPHLKADDFNREKRKLLTRLLQVKDDPEEIAETVFDYLIFGKTSPYSAPTAGYEESVMNISVEDVRDFYNKFIIPNNSTLIVVGNTSKEKLKSILESTLGNWQAKDLMKQDSWEKQTAESNIYLTDKKGSVQTEIRIGHSAEERSSSDYFAKHLMNTILGGQFSREDYFKSARKTWLYLRSLIEI